MLVLALDTATTVVTAGLVDLRPDAAPVTVAARAHDGRRHGELLMPAVRALCAEAGRALTEVEALVVGAGPGPFTGLRVGIASAAALGHALDVPVHGVVTHDAIAWSAGGTHIDTAWGLHTGGNLLVVTDARRREVYWAAYDASDPADAHSVRRLSGPAVEAPEALAARLDELAIGTVIGDPAFADRLGRDIGGPGAPTVEGLVGVAAADLLAGRAPAPVEPLYLRRPDAVEPTGRKRVTA
ncbi:TsaB protein, required for threonylcarbamoyladenosine (t(6)A) formation in tRNA [Pseudonocardia sp. Ae406_Ps2]|uniref:tRNA (adenosine(37)-N6)-threonylcarbamoyltransferase complex dimerization subunit type 1 TsaB n=1 Tax=unclassified Pseudonocardia TaxID=2619320 RepID=UPI00094B6E6A|nr:MULTISPECIES: tRNA (adenosine(37)-N6)-threonylcarbamoyltransferase complex dimerization subunit type 1 TsaB [unclassified Pseudonocardia]OLL97587.1 TsaB protein, required for threonylcarbamoyladenosine (t(6)A) formation in tRNA [Pseudonocardia sp. Ae331_Ps2]OLM04697.1 TsaB protein, required for threonylcarbamoyladenosine (t(6)A) formation in tRNA [Pseudonocardia sp. Ae406_Ps2]OLM10475.1 TsaB protein, required for threonylcarbamoyladenosine (t(6)A) formation in tRNA [Pseudonocardia sp. Ae505_P